MGGKVYRHARSPDPLSLSSTRREGSADEPLSPHRQAKGGPMVGAAPVGIATLRSNYSARGFAWWRKFRTEQRRQLGDVGGDAPRFVARHQPSRRAPSLDFNVVNLMLDLTNNLEAKGYRTKRKELEAIQRAALVTRRFA